MGRPSHHHIRSHQRHDDVKTRALLLGTVIGAVGLALLRFLFVPLPEPVHYHANFAMFIDGARVDLTGDTYMEDVAACKVDPSKIFPEERTHLQEVGKYNMVKQPAGTYAKKIMNRLLIDLSRNSSWLEGNTYLLLDTRRLIEFGEEAEGRDRLESQMILNHKDAIEFLVGTEAQIGFNR